MTQVFKNNAFAVLAGNITAASTQIVLGTGQGARFPLPSGGTWFLVTLVGLDSNGAESLWEIVKCTARSNDTLTVVRAQEGTTALTWGVGTRVELRVTAATLDSFTDTTQAAAAAPVQSVAGKTGMVTLVKGDVGLGNVDNTSDANKPVSTAQQTALNGKANTAHTHTIANVTALQATLSGKQDTLVSGTNIKTINGQSLIGAGDIKIGPATGWVGIQGGLGFGVGVCANQSILVARGLSAMTGTDDRAHPNYGNYQHTNGSIVCYVPKFFYRIGHTSSPRYATYGANALDIVGIETFADEAAANAAGYALHRAFINAGFEQSGFFFDKYLASKDGTTSCKSIANADPISLTTNANYNPSNGMTGCTGILADAVVLARARGAGWNCASAFMQDAVAMLSLAHGQAATSTTYCAWYDAAGVTNFPKGCNNNALADHLDASVTYAASYDRKPKTRATANFAKTTHNGQECGIADINGSMWQALIGLTMAGESATDATQNTTGDTYILKRTADFAALTGGFGGANDAWGTTSSLATNFDLINGFEPWLGTTGWTYLGNGSNAVFSNATSGTDYLRKCSGIHLLTGTSAAGTNQFGNDGCYQYGRANQVPFAAGYWGNAGSAGAFSRNWFFYRSHGNNYYGFRCAAY